MKRKKIIITKNIIILIILITTLTSFVESTNFNGLPYLCPEGINEEEVTKYCESLLDGSFIPDSNGLCNNKNCAKLKQEALSICIDKKNEQLNKQIKECNDKFNEIVKVYSYDWSKKENSNEMQNYETLTYKYGTFMIESCIERDNYIPINDYEAPECQTEFENNKLNNALDVKLWGQNLCQFENEMYSKLKTKTENYNKCVENCNNNIDIEKAYNCNEYNYWMYEESYCSKIYSQEEYDEIYEKNNKCQDDCITEFDKTEKEINNYYYQNCLAYSYYTYQEFYNMYIQYYDTYFSGGNFFKLKDKAEFTKNQINSKTKCNEGYKLIDGVCIIDVDETEEMKIETTTNVLDLSKTDSITGKIIYSCTGDCSGEPVVLNVDSEIPDIKYDINYNPKTSFLNKDNPIVDFTITPEFPELISFYKPEELKITLSTKTDKKEIQVKLMPVDSITIKKQFSEPIKQGDIVNLAISVNGPQDHSYTFILSSALDGIFYNNNKEMPITAIISSDSNQINVKWKTPLISRKLDARDFYIAELGQLSMEGLSAVTSTIAETLTGDTLKSIFPNSEKLIDNGIGTASAVNEFSTSDPLPFGMSLVGLLHENTIASLGGSLTYSSYQAYQRATKRFDSFNSDKVHIYDVPITITVHPSGYKEITKTIKIKVEAPEVILE